MASFLLRPSGPLPHARDVVVEQRCSAVLWNDGLLLQVFLWRREVAVPLPIWKKIATPCTCHYPMWPGGDREGERPCQPRESPSGTMIDGTIFSPPYICIPLIQNHRRRRQAAAFYVNIMYMVTVKNQHILFIDFTCLQTACTCTCLPMTEFPGQSREATCDRSV